MCLLCSTVLGKTTKPSGYNGLQQQNFLIPSLAHLSLKYNLLLKQPCRQLGVIQPTACTAVIHKDQFTEPKPTANVFQVVASWGGGGDKYKWPETNQRIMLCCRTMSDAFCRQVSNTANKQLT